MHYDHSGNITIFPNAQIYVSAEEIADFKKNPSSSFFSVIPNNLARTIKRIKRLPPNKIDNLEIVKVPGHTRGSIALIDRKRKLLFSGDTIFENGIGRTDLPNAVPEKMYESVQTLTNLMHNEGLKLCAGHDY